jgi:HEPN domain-containing protein
MWLIKAMNDLKSAEKLIEGYEPILDTAIYHTQQCAEKALKAYISYKQQPVIKTHDLELLVEISSSFDKSFNALYEDTEILNPYDTEFRYPDAILEPDMEDVRDAIEKAKMF